MSLRRALPDFRAKAEQNVEMCMRVVDATPSTVLDMWLSILFIHDSVMDDVLKKCCVLFHMGQEFYNFTQMPEGLLVPSGAGSQSNDDLLAIACKQLNHIVPPQFAAAAAVPSRGLDPIGAAAEGADESVSVPPTGERLGRCISAPSLLDAARHHAAAPAPWP